MHIFFEIFDVGAEDGDSCERYCKIFNNPTIYSFEPLPNQYNKMVKKFINNKNIFPFNIAIGNNTEKKNFNFIDNSGRSSFHSSLVDNIDKIQTIEVKVDTIDNYVRKHNIEKIDLLKIDVQGFEDEVLKGASESFKLNKIAVIEIELIIGKMYDNVLSFYDIEKIINSYGFRLFALTNPHTYDKHSMNIIELPTMQFDLIYVHEEKYKNYF